jgi:soluble lytic murein transglycosylase-like protein
MELMTIIQSCMIKASLMTGVDVATINAVASLESTYNIHAKSNTQDYGLMQLHKKKIFDPCKNALHGAELLKDAKVRLSKKLGSAWIIGYNLGVTGARRFTALGAKEFRYYKLFKRHFKPLDMVELLLFKDLPKVNKKYVTIPYRVF